ncbi:ABC transporter permease subunit [Bailinhaonella thermotolerans]|uniref:ABC transporter permease n=1 Tax=Bailinhaonella thermotolerans TaxID=1070861 RepID=A0A3A4A478_9ACTN|nr:ABC transporter permease subunit [Bailinhaonella thermotolerans]RJL23556.1 ABC transporter permease [Bailinhaonella thermotolerans]
MHPEAAPDIRGVIHDIGYRRYDGPRLGRLHGFGTLFLHGLRGVFGLGRTAKAKVMPFLMVTIMLLPAVVAIAVMALLKEAPLPYQQLSVIMQPVLAIFLASQAPVLVALDQRFHVLPLYFSRPGSRMDYVLARYSAMAAALFLILALPLTVEFVGELLVDPPGPVHLGAYLSSMAGAVLLAITLGALGLAVAAATHRRGLGVAAVIAVYLVLTVMSGVLLGVFMATGNDDKAQWANLINPFHLVDAVRAWAFGHPPGDFAYPDGLAGGLIPLGAMLLVIAASLGLLAARYRKVGS